MDNTWQPLALLAVLNHQKFEATHTPSASVMHMQLIQISNKNQRKTILCDGEQAVIEMNEYAEVLRYGT